MVRFCQWGELLVIARRLGNKSADPRKIRYVRDYLNGSNKNTSNNWVEVQVFNTSGTNVSQGKIPTYTGTKAGSSTTSVVTNGSTSISSSSDYFETTGGLCYIQIDLGSLIVCSHVKSWHYWADSRIYHNTKVEVSANGVTWRTIFDSAVSGEYTETSSGHTAYL